MGAAELLLAGKKMPNQARLQELFSYAEKTGLLIRKSTVGGRLAGTRAGHTHKTGYRNLLVDGRSFREHRAIWCLVHGDWPDCEIDHVNGDPSDNRLENLRLATKSQNARNRRVRRGVASGVKGVSAVTGSSRWQARIFANGKEHYLGCFATIEAARAAYAEAADELHGEFAST